MPSTIITASPPSPTTTQSHPPKLRKQKQKQSTQTKHHTPLQTNVRTTHLTITTTLTLPMAPAPTRLLVASIGNPSPYLNTLHSAGHTVLHALRTHLSAPSLTKSRLHANGLLSHISSPPLTLWHSPSLMNASGPPLATAWSAFVREYPGAGLVVLHDELESALGRVTVRSGAAGARGHNGLRSIKGSKVGGVPHVRIGIGIGRPESREAAVVAGYVLRKMTGEEREAVEGCVGEVMVELERLLEGGE